MEKIPTAEEFAKESFMDMESGFSFHYNYDNISQHLIKKAMIEFAKMHVEAALKQAAHESQCYNKAKFPGDQNWVVDIESILNSYSLDKIK